MKQIAVGTCLFVSDSVLDQYITQRMCDKSGFENKFILKSRFDGYKTKKFGIKLLIRICEP